MPTPPQGAKKPADRKPKAAEKPETVTVNLHDQDWSVSVDAIDDFELLDDLAALQNEGDATRLPSVMRRLLGDDYKRALDALRDEKSGRVRIEPASEFLSELLTALDPN